jgi:hypothetical protein
MAWEHGVDPGLRPITLWQHIEHALDHTDSENDEVQTAVGVVRGIIDRNRAATGLIEVTDDELAAIKLAVTDGCEYMAINNYADGDTFPEDAGAVSVLKGGGIGWICWRDPERESHDRQ